MNVIFKNLISGFGVKVISVLITLATTPIILSGLGAEGFGTVALILGLVGFGGVLDLGFTQSLVKGIASSDEASVKSVYLTGATIFFVISVVVFLGINLLDTCIYELFLSDLELNDERISSLMAVIAITIFLKFMSLYLAAVLNAYERIHENNVANISGSVFRLTLIAVLSFYYNDITDLLFVFPMSFLVVISIQLIYVIRFRLFQIGAGPSKLSISAFRTLSRDALSIFVVQSSSEAALHSDKFIISYSLGLSAVSTYTIAYTLAARVSDIGSLISSVTFPHMAKGWSLNNLRSFKLVYSRFMKYTLALGIMAAVLLIFAFPLVDIWVGPAMAKSVYEVLPLLLIGVVVGLPSWINGNILIIVGKSKIVAKIAFFCSAISVYLCFELTNKYGLEGAAASWSIGYLLISVLQMYFVRFTTRSLAK